MNTRMYRSGVVVVGALFVVACSPSSVELTTGSELDAGTSGDAQEMGARLEGDLGGVESSDMRRAHSPDMRSVPQADMSSEMLAEDMRSPELDMKPACAPSSCADVGWECGVVDDGCGGELDCGGCEGDSICDAGRCEAPAADCMGIANTPGYELCVSSTSECAGVFTQGGNCDEFCAAAGMVCKAHYGGEAGCVGPEFNNNHGCGARTGHQSDWCVCEPGAPVDPGPDPGCSGVGQARSQGHQQASYAPRSSWVLQCRPDYAYTAQFAEHEDCDPLYQRGSGRGTATFTFPNVASGLYDVHISGRHTENRNPAGAVVHVDVGGARYTERIMQRDSSGGINKILHGTYCLSGTVTVIMDSTVSSQSDSISGVSLEPR